MDFQTWYRQADIPMKDENGVWYDAETGFQFKAVKRVKKTTKQIPGIDTPEFQEARSTCVRHLGSQKIAVEKALQLGLDPAAIAKAETFILRAEKLLSKGATMSGFRRLVLENSAVSRSLNSGLVDMQRNAV